MFHVKHPTPDEIAIRVIAPLENFLRDTGPFTPRAGFVDKMARFASLLTRWGARFNLTAEPDNPDEIAFHIIDSMTPLVVASGEPSPLADAFAADANVLDLGSGAGFPALVLAAGSEARFQLVESRRKRASFLTAASHEMNLINVTIDPSRRTKADFSPDFDTVTARAFGPAPEFHRIAAHALRSGGRAILYANPGQALMPEYAESVGLGAYREIRYEIPRGGAATSRILAIWHRR